MSAVIDTNTVLELKSIYSGYADVPVLRDVSIAVPAGKVIALLGPNGAGKTTTLRVAAGLLRPWKGMVSVDGHDVTNQSCNDRVNRGICLIPEGRGIFRSLTVTENLQLFEHHRRGTSKRRDADRLDRAFSQFPALQRLSKQVAGRLSGGQQQMLALSRAYMADPSCILIDEASLGLAPMIVDEVYQAIQNLASAGTSMIIVEQYVHRALALADLVVLLQKGTISLIAPPSLLDEDQIAAAYLASPPTTPSPE